jgi:hypothetical protein
MVRFVYRSLVSFSILSCLVLLPRQANAEIIGFSGLGAASIVTVGGTTASNYHGSVNAGELQWLWLGTPPAGFAQSFYSYCVDLANFVTPLQVVSPTSSVGFTNGVSNGGAKAAWLFNQYAAGIHQLGNTATAAVNAAALQIAIWEAMYDSSRDLGGGGFTATASNGGVVTKANEYLTALYLSDMTSVATILNASWLTGGQDQIVAQVSEPSTLLLLGLAFFGFATLTRRQVRVS